VTLKDLIAAKQRRTARLPILVGDPRAAAVEVETFRTALRIHQEQAKGRADAGHQPDEADRAEEERLRQALKDANDRAAATVVEVEVQALPADEWDAIFGPIEPDENGELDITDLHAALLAASCVDPDLRDEAWWKEQLARDDIWSKGDRMTITNVLLQLNVYGPPGIPGKG
jgi:hypothetical protein